MVKRRIALLQELPNVRQVPGERRRRWFASRTIDLIVWLDDGGAPSGFQLCYDKNKRERALTFTTQGGFSHSAVDGGDSVRSGQKGAPVLASRASFDTARVFALFVAASAELPAPIRDLVTEKILQYPGRPMERL